MVIQKMVYNLQALNCVQEVAGYPYVADLSAEPNNKADAYIPILAGGHGLTHGVVGPDGFLPVSSHGLVGGHGLTPGVVGHDGNHLVSGHYLTPSEVGPDGRPLVFGKRSAVAAPEVVPTFNLAPTLIHAPAHDSASIESHRLGGNFAYGQGLVGGHGLIGGNSLAHGLIGGSNVREPTGMVKNPKKRLNQDIGVQKNNLVLQISTQLKPTMIR